jgi:hypothetical protein
MIQFTHYDNKNQGFTKLSLTNTKIVRLIVNFGKSCRYQESIVLFVILNLVNL